MPREAAHALMPTKRTPALGFILITLTLDILGIGLILPILPKPVKEFSGGDTAAASQAALTGWPHVSSLLRYSCP